MSILIRSRHTRCVGHGCAAQTPYTQFCWSPSLWVVVSTLLLLCCTQPTVRADSPLNLSADIAWSAGLTGVADVEAAFNNARRQEELQLGLATNVLGTLDLPAQATWDTFSDDRKALFLLNAERRARGNGTILGLPLAGLESRLDSLAQAYADLQVANNVAGHTADGTPEDRLNRVFGNPQTSPATACREFMSRLENLAYFFTSQNSNALVIERAVYNWIYKDAASSWGHREAALLQDKTALNSTANPGQLWGYKNNVGAATHEGFLGIGRASAVGYDPYHFGMRFGEVVVMKIIDPDVIPATCLGNADRSALAQSIVRTTPAVAGVGSTITYQIALTNTGDTLLSNVTLTGTFDTLYLDFMSASMAPGSSNEAQGTLLWSDLAQTLSDRTLDPGESMAFTVNFVAVGKTPDPTLAFAGTSLQALGGWAGRVSATPTQAQGVEIEAPIINEIDYDQSGATDGAEFIELKNPSPAAIQLAPLQLLLIDGNGGGAATYATLALPAVTLAPGDYFVICANAATTPNCDHDVTPDTNLLQNGAPDAVALIAAGKVVDTVSYGGNSGAPYTEGSGSGLADDANPLTGIVRFPDGVDSNRNNVDWSLRCVTPGTANGASTTNCDKSDLRLTQTVSPGGPLLPGQPLTITVTFANNGGATAQNVTLQIDLAATMLVRSVAQAGVNMTATTAVSPYRWTVADLPNGAQGQLTLRGIVQPALTTAAPLTVVSTVSGSADLTTADNSASQSVPISLPQVKLSSSALQGAEDQGSLPVTATLDPINPYAPVTVTVSLTAGSADSSDYRTPLAPLTIGAGQRQALLSIPINADSLVEGDESFAATLTTAQGAQLMVPTTMTLTINNDDMAAFTISDVTQREGDSGHTRFALTVTLSAPVAETVTVLATVTDDSAIGNDDYVVLGSQTLTFPVGAALQQPVVVTVIGDEVIEADEQFMVQLSAIHVGGRTNDSRLSLAKATGRGTILDDDRFADLGDYVWHDQNENGIQDAEEPGLANVIVRLYTGDQLLGSALTDSTGHYHFADLLPGDYVLEFVPPTPYAIVEVDSDRLLDDLLDSDANPQTGRVAVTLSAGQVDHSVDAGLSEASPGGALYLPMIQR